TGSRGRVKPNGKKYAGMDAFADFDRHWPRFGLFFQLTKTHNSCLSLLNHLGETNAEREAVA
ncbi:MAG: hypothetical protein PHW43_01075, partial [Syntrophales bacterium]|nr:hypothetical protein [Syntrophales bacterium]